MKRALALLVLVVACGAPAPVQKPIATIPVPTVTAAAPAPFQPHEEKVGAFFVAATGDMCDFDVSLLEGGTFIHAAARDAARETYETNAIALVGPNGIETPTRAPASKLEGSWPDDAWIWSLPDYALGTIVSHWTGASWEGRPHPNSGQVIALVRTNGTRVVAETIVEANETKNRGCLVFDPKVATPICTKWMSSGPLAGSTIIPFEDGVCQLGVDEVTTNGAGEIEVRGRLCTLKSRVVWRGNRWHSIAAPPNIEGYDTLRTFHFGADTFMVRTHDFEKTPTATVYSCTEKACTVLGARALPQTTDVNTPLDFFRDADGTLFLLAGTELARFANKAWVLEPLPAPVTSFSSLHWATADGKLFEREGTSWKEIALPSFQAKKAIAKGDALFVVASYDNGDCKKGQVLLRNKSGPPTLHCRAGMLRTTPPPTPLRSVIPLGNGMRWATLEAFAGVPPELAPHLRVVRKLGRGFTNLLCVDTIDPTLRIRAEAFSKKWRSEMENPLCVDDANIGPITELPVDWRTPN